MTLLWICEFVDKVKAMKIDEVSGEHSRRKCDYISFAAGITDGCRMPTKYIAPTSVFETPKNAMSS